MAFRVGQKVVCVDDRPRAYRENPLVLGGIYTIAGLPIEPSGEIGVFLVEVESSAPFGFYPDRFRPIVEKKTDINFAHEILRKVSRKDRVRA